MKRIPPLCWLVGLLLAGWALFGVAGHSVAGLAANQVGDALLRFGRGKFNNPETFIYWRMVELLGLSSAAVGWLAVHTLVGRRLSTHSSGQNSQWIAQALVGFVGLNVWIGFAMKTVLFWGVLGAGAGHENYTQFQFKRILAGEVSATRRAVLVGSSQTRAQIDEGLLNDRLGTNLWTTELHYPGSKSSDLLAIQPQLELAKADLIICYVTEGYFFSGASGETVPAFLSLQQLTDTEIRRLLRFIPGRETAYGLLGSALPLFRCRGAISQRLLGPTVMQLDQARYDASLDVDLDMRAAKIATSFESGPGSEMQKQALEAFVTRCDAEGQRVILIEGGYNPILMHHLKPELREDMTGFLAELQSRHANVTVVAAASLIDQAAADYDDLNHASLDMQQRFTGALAEWLRSHPEITSMQSAK